MLSQSMCALLPSVTKSGERVFVSIFFFTERETITNTRIYMYVCDSTKSVMIFFLNVFFMTLNANTFTHTVTAYSYTYTYAHMRHHIFLFVFYLCSPVLLALPLSLSLCLLFTSFILTFHSFIKSNGKACIRVFLFISFFVLLVMSTCVCVL